MSTFVVVVVFVFVIVNTIAVDIDVDMVGRRETWKEEEDGKLIVASVGGRARLHF